MGVGATIQMWGNSAAIRIPKAILESCNITTDSKVEMFARQNEIVIKKKAKTLDELFKNFQGEYISPEVDWGNPEGREVW